MSKPKRYQLLCPIARALDRVGDRWTLLILRDLYAGPARFSGLKAGLDGMATNLLTARLKQLVADGLVTQRRAEFGVRVYELTELGRKARDLLFELALFGGRFPPDDDIKPPGSLRTIAVTLEAACQRVVKPAMDFVAGLDVDGERFTLTAKAGSVTVRAGEAEAPDVEFFTEYEPMVAAGDGRMPLADFTANHMRVAGHTPGKDAEAAHLLSSAMSRIAGAA